MILWDCEDTFFSRNCCTTLGKARHYFKLLFSVSSHTLVPTTGPQSSESRFSGSSSFCECERSSSFESRALIDHLHANCHCLGVFSSEKCHNEERANRGTVWRRIQWSNGMIAFYLFVDRLGRHTRPTTFNPKMGFTWKWTKLFHCYSWWREMTGVRFFRTMRPITLRRLMSSCQWRALFQATEMVKRSCIFQFY